MLNLDHFIADCRAALGERSPELAIREILERVVANPDTGEVFGYLLPPWDRHSLHAAARPPARGS